MRTWPELTRKDPSAMSAEQYDSCFSCWPVEGRKESWVACIDGQWEAGKTAPHRWADASRFSSIETFRPLPARVSSDCVVESQTDFMARFCVPLGGDTMECCGRQRNEPAAAGRTPMTAGTGLVCFQAEIANCRAPSCPSSRVGLEWRLL